MTWLPNPPPPLTTISFFSETMNFLRGLLHALGPNTFLSFYMIIFVTDSKTGVCYTELIQGQCRTEMPRRLSLKDCCCSSGVGWSENRVCQLCPPRSSGKGQYRRKFYVRGSLLTKSFVPLFFYE